MPRVLVFTPTHDDLLEAETVASVEALRFTAGTFDWVVSDENPHPGRDMRNVVHQFQKGRRLALEGGYDAMLSVEHDMIVPSDALDRLWATDAGVVYGCYQLRHKMRSVNLFRYENSRSVGMSLSLYPRDLNLARQQGWIEVSGAGFGCLLFRRQVLEGVPFRDAGNAPDLPFASDCVRRSIKQIGRTDVVCGHIDKVWANATLWPFDEKDLGMIAKVEALQNVTILDEGDAVPMVKGKYYSLSVTAAAEAQRAGYVRIANDVEGARETATAEERETAEAPIAKRRAKRA